MEDLAIETIVRGACCLPRLCIVDLDKTVWSSFDAAASSPPYRRVGECEVRDAHGQRIRMHAETPKILATLRASGCRIAVASLNPDYERCTTLLAALGILSLLEKSLIKIRSGAGKHGHLTEIQALAEIPFHDMIFFDDLKANVHTGLKLGITSIQVSSSLLCSATLSQALKEHAAARGSRRFIDSWLVKGGARPVVADAGARGKGGERGALKQDQGCEGLGGTPGERKAEIEARASPLVKSSELCSETYSPLPQMPSAPHRNGCDLFGGSSGSHGARRISGAKRRTAAAPVTERGDIKTGRQMKDSLRSYFIPLSRSTPMSQTLGGGDQDGGERGGGERDGCERDGEQRDGCERSSGLQGSTSRLDDECAGSRSRQGDACAGGDGGVAVRVAAPFIMGYDQWVNGEEEEEEEEELT